MLSQFTGDLIKSSLKHFLDIEPVISDSIIAQAAARMMVAREACAAGLSATASRLEQMEQSMQALFAAAGNALRYGAGS